MGKLKNTLLKAKQCIPDFLSDLHESISALIAIVCVTAIASLTIILMIEVQYYFIIVAIALIALREFLERYKKSSTTYLLRSHAVAVTLTSSDAE